MSQQTIEMPNDKNNDYVLTHFNTVTSQRESGGTLDQIPFIFGALKNSPLALRQVLEVILAQVVWQTTSVANSGTLSVGADDVVIMSGHSATITLPALTDGRVLVVKDTSGAAGATGQAITVNRAGSDTIEGSSTSFSLAADYGAAVFIGDGETSKWHIIALV